MSFKNIFLPEIICVGYATLAKQQVNQPRRAHPRVRIRVGYDPVDEGNAQYFDDRIVAQA